MITTARSGRSRSTCAIRSIPDSAPSRRVDEQRIEIRLIDRLERRGDVAGLADRVPHRLEGDLQGLANVRFVVNDQDPHGSLTR